MKVVVLMCDAFWRQEIFGFHAEHDIFVIIVTNVFISD